MGNTLSKGGLGMFSLKICNESALAKLNNQINKLKETGDINSLKELLNETVEELESIIEDNKLITKFKMETVYQENSFSISSTQNSILNAKDKAVYFLNRLSNEIKTIKQDENKITDNEFTDDIALIIIRKILNNFYKHIEAMYEDKVHGRGTILKDNLDKIKIGNEYDVQRILYSIIKPIFLEARLEVSNDTGYGTIRYDIIIEKHQIIIEVKCTRDSMSEKKLTEELGSDAFHYKYNNLFFFIYDKGKIVVNKEAFINAYSKSYSDKKIETVIIQPITL
jgi:hypothetical protein